MTHFKSEEEYQLFLMRNQSIIKTNHEADPGPESQLQSKIKTHCKQQGWPVLAFPQSRAVMTYLPPGWPDITIILPSGTVLFLELKALKGRMSPEQRLMRQMFNYLGHSIYEVRSWLSFVNVVEGMMRRE